jgi:hypothetical protein
MSNNNNQPSNLSHHDLPARWNSRDIQEQIRFIKKALTFESEIIRSATSNTQSLIAERQEEFHLKIQELQTQHTLELQRTRDNITHKEQIHQEQLRETRLSYQEQIKELHTRLNQLDNDYRIRQERDLSHLQSSMERERKQYQEQIKELRQQIHIERTKTETELTTKINEIHSYHARIQQNSAVAGQFGENEYLQWSQQHLRGVDTHDNNAENLKHIGDFIHHFPNDIKVMVDTKNYTHPVSARERRKLHSDMIQHPEIDAGCLVSYQSCIQGFAGDDIYSLERLEDGRPILYIHHFGQNRQIYIGILQLLVRQIYDSKKSGQSTATELQNKIDTTLRDHIQPHLRQIKSLRKTLTDLSNTANHMELSIQNIINTLQ